MIRIATYLTLISLLLSVTCLGQPSPKAMDKNRAAAEKIAAQSNVADVKMISGEKLKGRISAISPDSFTLTDTKTNSSRSIAFSDVTKISKHHSGLSTGAWIAIAAGAAAAIVLFSVYRSIYCNEQAC